MGRRHAEGVIARIFQIMACWLCLLAFPTTATWALSGRPERCEIVPNIWVPSLDQALSYMEDSSKSESNTTQRRLTQISQNLADLRDAQLYIVYVRLMETLDPKERAKLFDEQKRWLDKRTELARNSVTSKGGSLEPLEYSSSFDEVTIKRLAELQERLRRNNNSDK
jgi:uncharacterized protein YecT (DUF1311 family)